LPGFYIGYNSTVRTTRTVRIDSNTTFVQNITILARNDSCSERHYRAEGCLMPQPCEPADACIGDDFCSKPYYSNAPEYRCNKCTFGVSAGVVVSRMRALVTLLLARPFIARCSEYGDVM
jgi:hypothetical protein